MDAKQLAEMSAHARNESDRHAADAARWRDTVRRSILRRAHEIAYRPGTPIVNEAGIFAKKVAEWTDDYDIQHYVVYLRGRLVKSIALVPILRAGCFKRETHGLFSNKLLVEHLYQHFKPLMEDLPPEKS